MAGPAASRGEVPAAALRTHLPSFPDLRRHGHVPQYQCGIWPAGPRNPRLACGPAGAASGHVWAHDQLSSGPVVCIAVARGDVAADHGGLGAATTIVNAKVFDGTKSQDWTSVRFADGLITKCSAASAAQEGDEVIDAGGGTVLPGLIDAHVHLVPGALAQSLTFGVTTVLDMFSKPDLVASAKEQAGSRLDVADVRSSGVGATAPGGHPSMMYAPFPTLTAAGQAERFVEERIAEGSDYLKIISGTGGLWPSLDPETIQALVLAGHRRGLVVVAHVSSTAGVEEVVSAGVDVVAHVPAHAELDKVLAERMAEAGIVVGPTLATIENTLGEPGGAARQDDRSRARLAVTRDRVGSPLQG